MGKRQPETPEVLRVTNVTRQVELGSSILLADRGETRRKGLLGRTGLNPGEGLWIVPCEAVHTVGMKFAIDVVYLDRKHKVRKVVHSMGRWRISGCFTAHSTLELPAGTARATGTQAGDQLEMQSLTAI